MVVVCNVETCEYRSKNGFCKRRVLAIYGGQCIYLTKKLNGVQEFPIYLDEYKPGIGEQRHELYSRLVNILADAAKEINND